MNFEHFALNVPNPIEQAKWYEKYCGMKIIKSLNQYPFTHFLSDESGAIVMEIYSNCLAPVPDYSKMNPLQFHFAFAVENIIETKDKLINAGASLIEEITLEDGSQVVMLKDPFGLSFQLCKRAINFFDKL